MPSKYIASQGDVLDGTTTDLGCSVQIETWASSALCLSVIVIGKADVPMANNSQKVIDSHVDSQGSWLPIGRATTGLEPKIAK